jgi:hypothetical protein
MIFRATLVGSATLIGASAHVLSIGTTLWWRQENSAPAERVGDIEEGKDWSIFFTTTGGLYHGDQGFSILHGAFVAGPRHGSKVR